MPSVILPPAQGLCLPQMIEEEPASSQHCEVYRTRIVNKKLLESQEQRLVGLELRIRSSRSRRAGRYVYHMGGFSHIRGAYCHRRKRISQHPLKYSWLLVVGCWLLLKS